jgi:hypothetical protein
MNASRKTLKETTMNIRIITIAAAATVAAVGFAAPASSASLGAAGQTIAQTVGKGVDSPVLQVGKKHGKHGKWHGKHGGWHGKHGKWYGHGYGFYPTYGYAPYPYGGCYQQVQVNLGGHYVLQTVKIC